MNGVEADAELLSVLVQFFDSVGLSSEDLVIRISSRKVLEEVLGSLGHRRRDICTNMCYRR